MKQTAEAPTGWGPVAIDARRGSGSYEVSTSFTDFFLSDVECGFDDCALEFVAGSGVDNLAAFNQNGTGWAEYSTDNDYVGAGEYLW